MFCQQCGTQIPEGALSCPACGSAVSQAQYGQAGYNQAPPQYGQPQYQQAPPQYGQVPPQNPNMYRDLDTAKTLGVVSIVMAFFFPLVCWICGGIGISKANGIINMAQMNNDAYLLEEAKSAKKTNKIGVIIGIVLTAVSVLLSIILVLVPLVIAGASQY